MKIRLDVNRAPSGAPMLVGLWLEGFGWILRGGKAPLWTMRAEIDLADFDDEIRAAKLKPLPVAGRSGDGRRHVPLRVFPATHAAEPHAAEPHAAEPHAAKPRDVVVLTDEREFLFRARTASSTGEAIENIVRAVEGIIELLVHRESE